MQQMPAMPQLQLQQGQTQRVPVMLAGSTGGYIGQQIDPAKTINLYNVTLPGLPTPAQVAIPGTVTRYTQSGAAQANTRGAFSTGELVFAAFSSTITVTDTSLTVVGTFTIGTLDGKVNFAANNGGQVMLVDGVAGWVYDIAGNTLTQITDTFFTSFSNPNDVDYLDGNMFVTFGSGNIWIISNIEDATTYNALNQAKLTSAGNQKLVGVRIVSSRVFFFGNTVTEVWYGTGQVSEFPWIRDSNSTIAWGCASNSSICAGTIQVKSMYRIYPDIENVIVWLGRQSQGSPKILMAFMGEASVISDDATEYKIQQMTTINDAVGYLYTINAHTFYLITFPTENLTLVYDFDMKQWHEQQMISGDKYFSSCHTMVGNKHYLGHLAAASLSEMDDTFLSNDGEAIHCVRALSTFNLPTYERSSIVRFDLNMRKGEGYKTTEEIDGLHYNNFNIDPKIYLSHSLDGGYTYSQQRENTIGQVGQSDWKVFWTGFPVSQRHNFRIETFNDVKTIFLSASMQVTNMGY